MSRPIGPNPSVRPSFRGPGSHQRYSSTFGNEYQQYPDTRGGLGASQSGYESYESHSDYNPPARRPYPGQNMGGYRGVEGSHTSISPPARPQAINDYTAPATDGNWELTLLQKDVRVLELDLKGMRREVADLSDSMTQLQNQMQVFLDRTQGFMEIAADMNHLKMFKQDAGDKLSQLNHFQNRLEKYMKLQRNLNFKFNALSGKKIAQTFLELKKRAEKVKPRPQIQVANDGKRPADDEILVEGLKKRRRRWIEGEDMPDTCRLSYEILSETEMRLWNETISIVVPATKVFMGNHVVKNLNTKSLRRTCTRKPQIFVDFYGGREASNVVQAYFYNPVEDMRKLSLPRSFLNCSDVQIDNKHSGRAMFLYKNSWVWFPFTSEVFNNHGNQRTDLTSVTQGDWWNARFYFKYPYPEHGPDYEIRLITDSTYKFPEDSADETSDNESKSQLGNAFNQETRTELEKPVNRKSNVFTIRQGKVVVNETESADKKLEKKVLLAETGSDGEETSKETAEKATKDASSNEGSKENTPLLPGSTLEDSGAKENLPVQKHVQVTGDAPVKEDQNAQQEKLVQEAAEAQEGLPKETVSKD